jgi:hypothetical protein
MAKARSDPLLLWSTVSSLKYEIERDFAGGRHYVWCSPQFDSTAVARYAAGSTRAASSDPASIYREYHHAIKSRDRHSGKIEGQKSTLSGLAVEWHSAGAIDESERDEIIARVTLASFEQFAPLLLVIPFSVVKARAAVVPIDKRASNEVEYIVRDLIEAEFQICEPARCLI